MTDRLGIKLNLCDLPLQLANRGLNSLVFSLGIRKPFNGRFVALPRIRRHALWHGMSRTLD
jgi:hypothetical protein